MGIFGGNGGDDIQIEVELNTEGAEKSAVALENSLNNLDKSVNKAATSGFSNFQASVVTFAQGLQAAQQVAQLVTGTISTLGGAVLDLAQRGEKLGSLKEGFAALGGQTETIENARERVLGLVSATDLYALANKAMVAGLPDINKNFGDIADLGARLANTLGRDTTQSIEQLTQAISTGRAVQLQQLGIFVDSKKAVEDWAAANNRSVESLNELEKKQAVQKASLDAVKTSLETVAKVTDSSANAYDSLNNTYDDFLDNLGLAINENPKLKEGFREIEKAIGDLDLDRLAEDIGTLAGEAASLVAVLVPELSTSVRDIRIAFATFFDVIENNPLTRLVGQFDSLGKSIQQFKFSNLLSGIKDVTTSLSPFTKALDAVASKQFPQLEQNAKANAEALARLLPTTKDLSTAYQQALGSVVPLIGAYSSLSSVLAKDYQRAGKAAVAEVVGLTTATTNLDPPVKKLTDTLGEAAKSLGAVTKETYELANIQKLIIEKSLTKEFKQQIDNLSQGFADQIVSSEQYISILETMRKVWVDAGQSAETFDGILKGIDFKPTEAKLEEAKSFGKQIFDAIFGVDSGFSDAQQNAIAENIDSALGTIGSLISANLGDALGLESGGLGQQIGGSLGSIIGSALGGQAGGAIGNTAGNLLGSFADKLFGGKGDAQTKVRRNIEEIIDEAIRETNFQIINAEGKVVPFTDLILGDRGLFEPDSPFNQFIEQAPQQLTNAFLGVGGAIGETFAGEFSQGAQVGAILFDQFGGSIDNLKLLVLELGYTFEQAQDAMVSAFLAGDVGAVEVISRLRDMEEAFKPGLEGFAQFEKAFDNFIASAGEGRVSLKSLRDGAVEFKETGSESFAAYRQALEASGKYGADQIEKLFAALAARGITSLDQLADASDLTLIGVISDLQSAGFAFSDGFGQGAQEAADEIIKLRDTISQIPDNVEKRLTLRVSSVFEDRNAQAALDAATGGAPGIAR